MKVKATLVYLWTVALLVTFGSAVKATRADDQNIVQVPEAVLRNLATRTVMPDYPEKSKTQGSKGIAVAQLHLNEEGVLTNVEILEAPDAEIAQAVKKAVKQWKFKTVQVNDKPCLIVGKLTFYFVINGGAARVENPRKFKRLTINP